MHDENNDKLPETTRTSCLYSQIVFPFGHVRGTGVSMQETYRKLIDTFHPGVYFTLFNTPVMLHMLTIAPA